MNSGSELPEPFTSSAMFPSSQKRPTATVKERTACAPTLSRKASDASA